MDGKKGSELEVTAIEPSVLEDLESKYSTVACPIHDEPPKFEVAPDGAVVERFCCETLLKMVRQLQERAAAGKPDSD